jgi:hypothetical protein
MASNSDTQSTDPEIEHLKDKTAEGAANLVGSILENPAVQKTIKNALVKETIKSAIILSAFMVGLLNLYNVAKQQLGFTWQVETAISLVLVLIGLIYMIKNLFNGKKNGH